jgi:phospholipid/cholesterol/gamma-HCH transport system permease protein
LRASRSAACVGEATTSAVVNAIIAVIALDAVFAICAHALRI